MLEITDEQKKAYLENPNVCPMCKSAEIVCPGMAEATDNGFYRQVQCTMCNHQWVEHARIDDITELEKIQSCRVCGCTHYDCRQCIAKTGRPCHWVETDLCSACVPKAVT